MFPCRIVILLAALAAGAAALGQENPVPNDPVVGALGTRAGQFLDKVAAGQVPTAYQELLSGTLLAKQEALKTLLAKTIELEGKYGQCRGSERIAARRVGSDLVLLKYLYKCETFPVVWYFAFYRVPAPGGLSPEDDTWRVVSVRFDTELDALWY